jgi:hypothetical protein
MMSLRDTRLKASCLEAFSLVHPPSTINPVSAPALGSDASPCGSESVPVEVSHFHTPQEVCHRHLRSRRKYRWRKMLLHICHTARVIDT